jgi:cell division protease FtsH
MDTSKKTSEEMIEYIKQRRSELESISAKLKGDFVGLDEVIDQIIDSIKVWYIFPELQIRPSILCLWGLTGVGKTDLVRKLVSYLKFQDRFIEIEMSGESDTHKTVQRRLEESSVAPEDQCILFLDEFQKFRTVSEDGTASDSNTAYSDVWTLLSDGRFQSDLSKKTELVEQLLYSKYYKDYEDCEAKNAPKEKEKKTKAPVDPVVKVERTYHTPVYLARQVKRLFKLSESMEEIMKWNDAKIFELYNTFSNNSQIYEGESYKKMFIIISGNLDEAYKMADDVSSSDLDADYYHEFSKRLSIIDIKTALQKRFRPEQIARFGNSHVLYPSLSKKNYRNIIIKKCEQINQLLFDSKGISIIYDNSVYDLMYNNGVFPTQGVRPLLSTITTILSTSLPVFIFECLIQNVNSILITAEKNIFVANIKGKRIQIEIPTVLDKIREKTSDDMKYICIVHEIGHALVYSLLFNSPPKQICTNSISPFSNGFIMPHSITGHKESIIKITQIYLAGRIAEEIVFGTKLSSVGASEDLRSATAQVWAYISKYAFDGYIGSMTQKYEDFMIMNQHDIGKTCETMLQEAKKTTTDLITSNMQLFKELISFAINNPKITTQHFVDIFKQYNIPLIIIEDGESINVGYKSITEKFLGKN